jgi:hypothetical protein
MDQQQMRDTQADDQTTYTTDETGCSTSCGTDDFLSLVNGGCLERRGDIGISRLGRVLCRTGTYSERLVVLRHDGRA